MTPHRRWRRTNPRQMTPIAPRHGDLAAIAPRQEVKKSTDVLNVPRGCCDLSMWERLIPPHRLYSARAPIHPKRPYGLTRPVVPPDGSFLFSTAFPIFSGLPLKEISS